MRGREKNPADAGLSPRAARLRQEKTMKIPDSIRKLLATAAPAAHEIRTLIGERRALLAKRLQEGSRLVTHPSDRHDLEAVLTAAIDRVIDQSEKKFAGYLKAFVPLPDPEIGSRVGENLVMHLGDPRWHGPEAPEIAALLLPGLLREAVPDLAARMALRITAGQPDGQPAAFAPAEMPLAARMARYAELEDECQRISEEIRDLEAQAREAGLAI
jgi:hypothetical protein